LAKVKIKIYFFFLGFNDILFDISVNSIESSGFSRYLKVSGSNTRIRDDIYPPAGTTEILMGCGPNNMVETRIQLAAIMTPEEIFDEKDYPTSPTKAKGIRNFFGYQSTSRYDPIGFSGSDNIYIGYWDRYDCGIEGRCSVGNADKHRLSILLGMFTVLEIITDSRKYFELIHFIK